MKMMKMITMTNSVKIFGLIGKFQGLLKFCYVPIFEDHVGTLLAWDQSSFAQFWEGFPRFLASQQIIVQILVAVSTVSHLVEVG